MFWHHHLGVASNAVVDFGMTTSASRNRDIGFLGPDFLGIGLFSELPDRIDRLDFRAWLRSQERPYTKDQYDLNDLFLYELNLAFERVAPGPRLNTQSD